MKRQARAQNLDMVSQLQWRFRKYGALMFRMLCLVHPLFDEEYRWAFCESLYEMQDAGRLCCFDKGCIAKVVRHWPRATDLYGDQQLRRSLRVVAYSHRFGDMTSERLLARINKSVCKSGRGGRAPVVENVVSNGFLTQ